MRTPSLYDLQNMTLQEMRSWADNPRTRLASTATGRAWQSWLCSGEPIPSDLQHEIAYIIWRHARQVQKSGFGKAEASCKNRKKSGYTRRHITLMNLGLNPARPAPGVDLSLQDNLWLESHPDAIDRRLVSL